LVERQRAELASVARRQLLGLLDPGDEATGRSTQRELGVGRELAGDVDRRKEDVAELVRRRLATKLADLIVEVAQRTVEIRIVEAHAGRPPLNLLRMEERRKRLGHVVEDPFAPFLLGLELLPAALDVPRRPDVCV